MSWNAANASVGIGYSPPLFGTAVTTEPRFDQPKEPIHAEPESPKVSE